MGTYEWSGMAGGPVLIYLVRTIASAIYELRIDSLNAKLKDQQAVRAKTIQKLKDATRYDSTMELLEKYGGGEVRAKGKKKGKDEAPDEAGKKSPGKPQQQQRQNTGTRTNIPIPATANIQRHNMGPSNQGTPQPPGSGPYATPQQQQQQHRIPSPHQQALEPSAEFSPNAFDSSRLPRQQQYDSPNHWYDRIMDLLLGDDETAPKNRLVLICQRCRLVNGQAPPGTNNLAEVGVWKCMSCGAENGEVDEGRRLVKEVLGGQSAGASTDGGEESDLVEVQSVETRTEDGEDESKQQEEHQEEAPDVRKRKAKGRR